MPAASATMKRITNETVAYRLLKRCVIMRLSLATLAWYYYNTDMYRKSTMKIRDRAAVTMLNMAQRIACWIAARDRRYVLLCDSLTRALNSVYL